MQPDCVGEPFLISAKAENEIPPPGVPSLPRVTLGFHYPYRLYSLDLPRPEDRKKSQKYNRRRGKMKKKGTKRRVYTQECKAESAALVEKHEKPVSQTAAD
jgi:hypothetical protein